MRKWVWTFSRDWAKLLGFESNFLEKYETFTDIENEKYGKDGEALDRMDRKRVTMDDGDWKMVRRRPQASRSSRREEWRTKELCLERVGCWIAHRRRISSAESFTTRTGPWYEPIATRTSGSESRSPSPSIVDIASLKEAEDEGL